MVESLSPSDPRQVGPYRIEGRLGQGGMGSVFLGTSPAGRQVAVKLIRREFASAPHFRERFAREVEAARRVGGFHTAQVVDADPEAESPWLVTDFIAGPTLQQLVTGQGALSAEAVLRLGAGLAEGLAAIHKCGLVHRDLKPGNVIVAPDGPRIIDFGIAHAEDTGTMTHTGTLIGTYAYMSPEQIRTPAAVTPACDVFSLGSVLAFAATGRSPFDASNVPAIIHRVTSEPPVLTDLSGHPGLHRLVTTCLAKDPAARPSAAELLQRLSTTAAPTVVPPPASPPAPPPVPPAPPEASPMAPFSAAATVPDAAKPVGRRALMIGGIAAAATAAVAVPAYLLRPEDAPASDRKPTARGGGAARPSPSRDITRPVAQLTGHALGISCLAFAPDGSTLATGAQDKTLRLWDAGAGRLISTFEGHTENVMSVVYSPDGRTLFTGSFDKSLRSWDARSGAAKRVITTYEGEYDSVNCLAMSPDGKTLAVGVGSRVELVAPATGRSRATLTGHTGSMGWVAFSPDGRTVASVAADLKEGTIRLWNARTGRLTKTLTADRKKNYSQVRFSKDGDTLIANGAGVRLWDVAEGRSTRTLTDKHEYVLSAAYRPGKPGQGVIAGAGGYVEMEGVDTVGRSVTLWDMSTGKVTATLIGGPPKSTLRASIPALAFSPDGKTLAGVLNPAADADDVEPSVQLWRLT
ncbi:WD40 repeat domain-containing serine/threonine protein kinase [Streptomyces sp. NPDC087300]|uniref:WD40 repeat domain-containing serine/threonine protein kinase n=1 Tax=Streptomyces sp. NPDC087300 TaxID=3365780 RepID=UPI0037FBD7AE